MRYLGGKSRLSKKFSYILDESLKNNSGIFIEPFVGGFNIVPELKNYKSTLCTDIHEGLIHLYNDLLNGFEIPDYIEEEQYNQLLKLKNNDSLSTYVSFACSFGGKEWGGYARGDQRNFCLESKKAILKKFSKIKKGKIIFKHCSYNNLNFKYMNCTIYCDPPYKDTTKYKTEDFNHDKFYDWAETQKKYAFCI